MKKAGAKRPALLREARFIVVTGLSGSGKSQAIRALEDLGYFCVDNLPIALVPTLARLSQRAGSGLPNVAIVVDVRERNFVSQFPAVLARLRAMRRLNPALIFLEASDTALVRRFSETRRPHPLARRRPVVEGIREERTQLAGIRALADETIDTSGLTVHELRDAFMAFARGRAAARELVVTLLSFGFKHGLPPESDLVFDARCLPNPHFVPALRRRTGRDRAVVRFMERHQATGEFLDRTADLLEFLIPLYVAEGKSYLTVAVGCTGGRHRSVMLAEALSRRLARFAGVRLRVRHRDIDAED
ncbi:MAG: RNase adapter RapZ [Vicinamibacterales bacterium]